MVSAKDEARESQTPTRSYMPWNCGLRWQVGSWRKDGGHKEPQKGFSRESTVQIWKLLVAGETKYGGERQGMCQRGLGHIKGLRARREWEMKAHRCLEKRTSLQVILWLRNAECLSTPEFYQEHWLANDTANFPKSQFKLILSSFSNFYRGEGER